MITHIMIHKKSLETKLAGPIKGLNTDKGHDCEVKKFCNDNGIRNLNTMPYISEQNGITKERNGHSWNW